MTKNYIITSFNNHRDFFYRGLTLIESIHRNSFDSVEKIIVYNLGFDKELREYLEYYEKVEIRDFPEAIEKDTFEGYLSPGQFGWKIFLLKDSQDLNGNVLYLDSGVAALRDLSPIFEIIQREDIFLVGNSPVNISGKWTHAQALEMMNASAAEKNDVQISASIIGFKGRGKFSSYFEEAYEYSRKKEILFDGGLPHRHDQSIFSILATRYGIKKHSIYEYGEWRSIKSKNQILYAHRGKYIKLGGARFKKSVTFDSKIVKQVRKFIIRTKFWYIFYYHPKVWLYTFIRKFI